jgi:ABC-type nickel/cobalt efflux system permease component RcnA
MPVTRFAARAALALTLVAVAAPALAASPFGVGLPEQGGGWLPQVAALQKAFYRDLTAALKALRDSGQAAWWLAGVSFAYGVVHAAGPGHGKVVISSYLLANEESAKRGVAIAFLSAMAQALVAVLLVAVMAALLNMTSVAITDTAKILEVGSYALIAALGLTLLWRKGRGLLHARRAAQRRPFGVGAQAVHRHDDGHAHHGHACGCGHHHAPAPEVAAKARGPKAAAAAVLSVGVRPCSGALIVLVFALAQGIFWAGIASTFLMALGTAVTVAALAAPAVGAKGVAARLAAGDSGRARAVMLGLEIVGALLVTAFGLVLLAGSLTA